MASAVSCCSNHRVISKVFFSEKKNGCISQSSGSPRATFVVVSTTSTIFVYQNKKHKSRRHLISALRSATWYQSTCMRQVEKNPDLACLRPVRSPQNCLSPSQPRHLPLTLQQRCLRLASYLPSHHPCCCRHHERYMSAINRGFSRHRIRGHADTWNGDLQHGFHR